MLAEHTEVVSGLASPVSVLASPRIVPLSPVSGIASDVTILRHAGLESPLTGLTSSLAGRISPRATPISHRWHDLF